MTQPLTSNELSLLLDELAVKLETDPVTTYTDDNVLTALNRLKAAADKQIQAADHVRSRTSAQATRRRWRRRP